LEAITRTSLYTTPECNAGEEKGEFSCGKATSNKTDVSAIDLLECFGTYIFQNIMRLHISNLHSFGAFSFHISQGFCAFAVWNAEKVLCGE